MPQRKVTYPKGGRFSVGTRVLSAGASGAFGVAVVVRHEELRYTEEEMAQHGGEGGGYGDVVPDSSGPVVAYVASGETGWFPGQSMALLQVLPDLGFCERCDGKTTVRTPAGMFGMDADDIDCPDCYGTGRKLKED